MRKVFYLGIDLHARQLTVNLRDENGDVVLRRQVTSKAGEDPSLFRRTGVTVCATLLRLLDGRRGLWVQRLAG